MSGSLGLCRRVRGRKRARAPVVCANTRSADLPACAVLCAHPHVSPRPKTARTQVCGLCSGKCPRRRFKLFRSAGNQASTHLAMDLGGKGPNSDRGAGVAVRAPLAPPRAWNILPRPRSPAAVPGEVSSVALGGGGRVREGEQARSHAPPRWVLRPSPDRGGQGAASPKDAECWPRCNIESTSQALLQSPEASGSSQDHQARWKFLKCILCAL